MARGRKAKTITVNGVSATLEQHAAAHGIAYKTLMGRLSTDWTLEQALGLAPKPKRPRGKVDARWSNLQDGPRLADALDNLCAAISGEATAEEYLRREGVPANGYTLRSR